MREGGPHRELLNALERELIQIGYRWKIFCQLFDSGQKNVDLLNKSGSNVFQLLQKLLIDDLMMGLCRLADPAKSMGHENASLRNLVEKLDTYLADDSKRKIATELEELTKHLNKVTTLRNKAMSHTDLAHALDTSLLPRPTYDELEGALAAAKNVMKEITGRLYDYSSDYVPHLPAGCDGEKLLRVLAKAHGVKESGG
jgi:hypothetical protein